MDFDFETIRPNAAMFKRLETFPAIAWDFDETLIGSVGSKYLRSFVNFHPNIRHVIVTFRTHGLEELVWEDLDKVSPGLSQMFDEVFNPTDEMNFDYETSSQARRAGLITGPLTIAEIEMLEFKAKICAENEIKVLIDDMTDMVETGCRKFGIQYFHPMEFVK